MQSRIPTTIPMPVRQSVLAIAIAVVCAPALAWEIPSNLRESDDALMWNSDAPSYNIYEDGLYIATVHGATQFEPIFDNSMYRVVGHDHGSEFTPLSDPFLFVDAADDEMDDVEELEFAEFDLYFELNNTDGDLGIHSKVDGDAWSRLIYEDTNGRTMIEIQLNDSMAAQGLTELFFESAEPTFDELAPADFFARFPGGTYDVEGMTVEGEDIEAETELSHVLPAAPVLYIGSGASTPNEGCEDNPADDAEAFLDDTGSLPITWDPVMSNHPTLGAAGDVEVDGYEVVFESETFEVKVQVEADTTTFTLPAALVNSGEAGKVEVIVRDDTHNQVSTEACFNII